MSFFLSRIAGNPWFDEGRYYCYLIRHRNLSDEDLFATDDKKYQSHRQDGILRTVENNDPERDPETVAQWSNPASHRIRKTNAIDYPRSRNERG